jgi:Uma2 family endonuclease
MAADPARNQTTYTYEDYMAFSDDLRCEIINGQVYDMTPAPSTKHQRVTGKIFRLVGNHLESKKHPCQTFIAPTDVVLADDQVVQPDVFLVCNENKIQDKAIFGVPDVMFEVISAFTEVKDRREKMKLYEDYGVAEYFLVHPEQEYVEKYVLDEGGYKRAGLYKGEENFSIDAIELTLAAEDLFKR